MEQEKPESELARLRKEQEKTRRDEIYGGLSLAERAEYNRKAERLRALEGTIRERPKIQNMTALSILALTRK